LIRHVSPNSLMPAYAFHLVTPTKARVLWGAGV
jgi:hypothetical protein